MYPSSPPSPQPHPQPPPPVAATVPSLPMTVLQSLLIGFALAAVAGGLVLGAFTLFGTRTECASQGDGWCLVGWFLIGLLAGLLVACVVYVVIGLLYIHSKVPAGHRTLYVVLHLVSPIGLVMVLGVVAAIADAAQA